MNALLPNRIVWKLTPTRHHHSLRSLLSSSSAKPSASVPTADFLTTKHHISPETALKISLTSSHLKNPNRTDSILSRLVQTGFSESQIDQMINKYPRTLTISPEILNEKLDVFGESGFSTVDAIEIVSRNPWILYRSSENRIAPAIAVLKSVLGSTELVSKLLKRLGWFMKYDLEKTLIPNMEYLKKTFSLTSPQVAEYMTSFPRLFLLKPETVEESARRVAEMGLTWSPKMYMYAVAVACLVPPAKFGSKKRVLTGLGFSDDDVARMFNRCPQLFGLSEDNIRETVEVLLGSGRADRSFLVENTELINYSVEKRIKPRLEVLDALQERGLLLLPEKLSLSSVLIATNERFLVKYVGPNSDALGDDWVVSVLKKLGAKSPSLIKR